MPHSKLNFSVKIILFLGAILAIVQFFSGRSVWMDEAKLAFNIMDRSYIGLLEPLESVQVAPILFLWIEKFIIDLFGLHDWSFRLFPLIAFIAGCWGMYKLLKVLSIQNTTKVVAASLYAFCQPLIYYASEIKQYEVDVTVGILLTYFAVKPYTNTKRQILILSIAGVLAIALSNISVIILFAAGSYHWFQVYKQKKRAINRAIIPIVIWLFAFGAYFLAFIHDHPTRDYMASYWRDFAYMPFNVFSNEFWAFWKHSYFDIFGGILAINPKIPYLLHIYGIAWFLGVVTLIQKRQLSLLYILVAPFLVHIALSAFELYPFVKRLGLYLQPFFAITCAIGFVSSTQWIVEITNLKALKYGLVFPGLVVLGITLYTFPKDREEFKESYEYMLSRKRTQDKIFTNSGADNTWMYYEKIGYIGPEIHRIISGYHRYNFEKHHSQLDSLKGRVWFLVSHDYYDATAHKMTESKYMLAYLKKQGAKVLDQKENVGSSVYLLNIED